MLLPMLLTWAVAVYIFLPLHVRSERPILQGLEGPMPGLKFYVRSTNARTRPERYVPGLRGSMSGLVYHFRLIPRLEG